jgi:GntR family transcriptional repressor for pyruvate dehydrogenase complex
MASGNPILATLVEMVSSLYFEHRRRTLPRGRDLRETAIMHRNIYHAVRAHDADRARREMSVHLPRQARLNAVDVAAVRSFASIGA